jgi:hypothetical protein
MNTLIDTGMELIKPIFSLVLSDGQRWSVEAGWSVEAEWPDGTIEQVNTFKGYFEAASWLQTQSEPWLRERFISAY